MGANIKRLWIVSYQPIIKAVYINNIIFSEYFTEDLHKPDTALGTWNSAIDIYVLSLAHGNTQLIILFVSL